MKSDPVDRALLELTRPMMIVAALVARRPSLMANSKWSATTISMLNGTHPTFPDSALAYLWDTLAKIPALYHQRDTYAPWQSTGSPIKPISCLASLAAVRALLSRSTQLRDEISSQRCQWKASYPDADFFSVPCTAIPSTQPYPDMVVTHFTSPQAANVFTLYNAVLILIDQFIISTSQLLPACDIGAALEKCASEQIAAATTDIVQSIDYHLLSIEAQASSIASASAQSNFCLLLPMRIAYQVLSKSELALDIRKKLWLEDVFTFIKSGAGPWMANDQIFSIKKADRYQANIK
jgi:hypothetical protein